MAFKSIMCVVGGGGSDAVALNTALSLSHAFGGSLRIVYFSDYPVTPAAYSYGGSFGAGGLAQSTLESTKSFDLQKEIIASARKAAVGLAVQHGRKILDDSQAVAAEGEIRFKSTIDSVDVGLPNESRTVDLIVAGYDSRANDNLAPVLVALFHSSRPVMVVPRIPGAAFSDSAPKTIAVAWDGSQSASRAVREAIPLLHQASKVWILVTGDEVASADGASRAEIIAYLLVHGVEAQLAHPLKDGGNIGAVLLTEASNLGAELLVMGAYGHGHIAEMVLGGVTSDIVKHTHLPLFLVH